MRFYSLCTVGPGATLKRPWLPRGAREQLQGCSQGGGPSPFRALASLGGAILLLLLGDRLAHSYKVVMLAFRAASCRALRGVALAAELRALGAAAVLEPASPECLFMWLQY